MGINGVLIPDKILNATLNVEIHALIKKLENPVKNVEIFSMEKNDAFIFIYKKAFEFTVLGIANMLEQASGWAKIIIYRCLNNDFSRNMLKNAVSTAELPVQQRIISLLNIIKEEDFDKFGVVVNEVLN